MYFIHYLIASVLCFGSCDAFSGGGSSLNIDTIPVTLSSQAFLDRVYFTKSDAEKIMGEKAFLSDSSRVVKKDTLEWKSAYSADSKDQHTGKTGVVYFMIEQYGQESSAKNAYNLIKVSNANHQGVKTIHDIGDEAYFHSDGSNFFFILVRKGRAMFRIKVNKITSHTSRDEFYMVSRKIAENLQ